MYPLPYDTKKTVNSRGQDNSHIVNLGSWRDEAWKQTNPPIVPIDTQFAADYFWPQQEIQEYVNEQAYRTESPEMKAKDELISEKTQCLRKAAEVHRQVRKYAQSIAQPGIKLVDFTRNIEAVLR